MVLVELLSKSVHLVVNDECLSWSRGYETTTWHAGIMMLHSNSRYVPFPGYLILIWFTRLNQFPFDMGSDNTIHYSI